MVSTDKTYILDLGHTGENDVSEIVFDISEWRRLYGNGEILLNVQRKIDDVPYPVPLEIKGDTAVWNITDRDIEVSGEGKAELSYLVGDKIKKSVIYTTYVEKSLNDDIVKPEKGDTWLDEMTKKVLAAEGFSKLSESFTHGGTGVRQTEDTDNAEYFKNQTDLNAQSVEGSRVVVDELAKAVDLDAKEVFANKTTVVESKEAVDLAEQRINASVEDVQLMQLDVQTNKDEIDIAKTEVDKKSTEVADNAKAVGINAAATEENAKVAELAKNDAVTASNSATEAAKQAELSVNKGGYVYFNIKNGHLFFTRTETSEFDFKLEEGRLIAYAK